MKSAPVAAEGLSARYAAVRGTTMSIAAPLSAEDCAAQSMPDASPIRWHLAHTAWFFETFVLARATTGYKPFDARFDFLFNSYYDAIGARVARPMRGRMTRPDLAEVLEYRAHVDRAVARLLERGAPPALELGLNHEQQHQELMLTDLKHLFSLNPLRPVYRGLASPPVSAAAPWRFVRYEGGLHAIGHGGAGFAFDNEGPRHQVFTQPFELASRPATNGEFLEFVEAGGYQDPRWWLSDGWDWVVAESIRAPEYWSREERGWKVFTLGGERDLAPAEPVAHVSFYEADAFARWAEKRLPTEAEWDDAAPGALFGDVWEWTWSPYVAYPGFRPAPGALGEYNGKFMSNRMVLRGGSCASPRPHLRATYRNFFAPTARWQFSGIRLARDV